MLLLPLRCTVRVKTYPLSKALCISQKQKKNCYEKVKYVEQISQCTKEVESRLCSNLIHILAMVVPSLCSIEIEMVIHFELCQTGRLSMF